MGTSPDTSSSLSMRTRVIIIPLNPATTNVNDKVAKNIRTYYVLAALREKPAFEALKEEKYVR